MNTLERIKDEVAKEKGFREGWSDLFFPLSSIHANEYIQIVCERYARVCIEASLKEAAENVRVPVTMEEIKDWASTNRKSYDLHWSVDKSSITDEKNIKLL